MQETPDILKKILAHKKKELAARKKNLSLTDAKAKASDCEPVRGFVNAIQHCISTNNPAVIAEIKKASPSKGIIREDFKPADIAVSYEQAGACCLSVLTDKEFFQGSDKDLQSARKACNLPVLRKDFIIEPYQVYESRIIGSDCILLIVAALSDLQLQEFAEIASRVGAL